MLGSPQPDKKRQASCAVAALTALLVAVGTPSIAGADGPEGTFVGASVGQSIGEVLVWVPEGAVYHEATVEASETTWRLFGGYRWRYAGIECGYRDLGTAEDVIDGVPVSASSKGWDAFAVGIVPLGRLEVFGKLGAYFYDLERSDGSSPSYSLSSNASVGGVGVAVHWPSLSLRLEWERSLEQDMLSVVSVGVVLHLARP